ncbi:nickel insertion protein [Methanolobus sp. ZRKC2]
MTNVDNISCDSVPYIIEELMNLGAKNVHVIPAITKKGRNEFIFFIDTKEEKISDIAEFMAIETGTLGIRIFSTEHYSYNHEVRRLDLSFEINGNIEWTGTMSFKVIKNKQSEIISIRAEYDELKALTRSLNESGKQISLYEVKEMVENKALERLKDQNIQFRVIDAAFEKLTFSFSPSKTLVHKG